MGTWDKEHAVERLSNIDWSLVPDNARDFVMSYLLDSEAHTKIEALLAEAGRLNHKAKYTEGGYYEHTWQLLLDSPISPDAAEALTKLNGDTI